MQATIKVEKQVNIKEVRVELAVRYDDEDIPYDFPLRKGDLWCATIDMEGHIKDWPKGKSGEMHMKICDEGTYHLIDDDGNIVASIEGDYVPNNLLPPTDGYGDYVHFIINENGTIINWYSQPSIKDFFKED